MSFYVIADTKFSDGTYFVDPDVGIFDKKGMEEAKKLLYKKCLEDIQNKIDKNNEYYIIPHKNERAALLQMIEYYQKTCQIMKNYESVKFRLNYLNETIKSEEEENEKLIDVVCLNNMDDVIKTAGWEIVEIPVLNHCDDRILKEFM